MRWTPGGRSRNIEDRRGESGRGMIRRGAPLGIGGLLLLVVLSLLTGQDFLSLVGGGGAPVPDSTTTGTSGSAPLESSPEEERLMDFMSFVLDDAQATWHKVLPEQYQDARLVVFREAYPSACGLGEAAMGPFYCPGDRKVYLDLAFFDELRNRFGAPGEFAQAYVVAHEIGHHVQNLLGIERQVRQLQQSRPGAANPLSVRMELQADCFAGIWGHSTAQRKIIDGQDVEAGLNAAAAIGDDAIQKMTRGRVHPESFTHGSSQERVEWFRRGLESGNIEHCNTFSGAGRTTN